MSTSSIRSIFPGAIVEVDPSSVAVRNGTRKDHGSLRERIARVLVDADGDTKAITLKELATSLGNPSLIRKSDRMKSDQDIWLDIGWQFMSGCSGRHGQPAQFVRNDVDF